MFPVLKTFMVLIDKQTNTQNNYGLWKIPERNKEETVTENNGKAALDQGGHLQKNI